MIPYHEWRGQGRPPNDIGYPGDIYVDLTPGKYSLYGRTKSGWVPWTGLNFEKWHLVAHPHLDDRFLFCGESDIKWYSYDAIRSSRRFRDNSISPSLAIENVRGGEHLGDDINASYRPGKRKRTEDHIEENDDDDEGEGWLFNRPAGKLNSGQQTVRQYYRISFKSDAIISILAVLKIVRGRDCKCQTSKWRTSS
jgi:hypothetical protein